MFLTVTTACSSREEARAIARHLVEERLAACVQLTPIESVYRWHGAVETAAEILLAAKTTQPAFARVRDAIRAMHSYELPEITATPIADGSDAYLRWIDESVG